VLQTGVTDLPLTARGEQRILARRQETVGEGSEWLVHWIQSPVSHRLIELLDPANICMVFVSPRQRAHTTFHLLFGHLGQQVPEHVISELVREWDYG
jgi:sedoheptulose-bisphosphatase